VKLTEHFIITNLILIIFKCWISFKYIFPMVYKNYRYLREFITHNSPVNKYIVRELEIIKYLYKFYVAQP